MVCSQLKGSDTSTAESGSEAEDIASPKATRSYSHLRLTPVREEVRLSLSFYSIFSFDSHKEKERRHSILELFNIMFVEGLGNF